MKRIKGGWKSKLTKKDLKHLQEDAGVTTLAGMKRSHEGQEGMRLRHPGPAGEPCWHCKDIARKLGLPVKGDA